MTVRAVRRTLALAICVALPLLGAACEESTNSPSPVATFATTDVKVGTGAAAAVVGDTLSVNYAGWFYDPSKPDNKGVQFTSSTGIGAFEFVLGAGDVIQGWDQGIVGMRAGGVRRIVVPPSMAYGQTRYGIVPPNTPLVFDVELLEIVVIEDEGDDGAE